MLTAGIHLLAEYHGCDRALLDDLEALRGVMREAARASGAVVVAEVFQPFTPQGVTGVVVIEESHFSIHTWPESGYAAVDFYTCGDCDPERADAVLRVALGAERVEVMSVRRGIPGPGASLELTRHTRAALGPREQ